MRMERNSWERRHFEENELDEAVNAAASVVMIGFGGFVLAVVIHALAIYGVVETLYRQSAIDWHLEWWQGLSLSCAYFVVRSMNRVMYKK